MSVNLLCDTPICREDRPCCEVKRSRQLWRGCRATCNPSEGCYNAHKRPKFKVNPVDSRLNKSRDTPWRISTRPVDKSLGANLESSGQATISRWLGNFQ